jgi:hypothetical protein
MAFPFSGFQMFMFVITFGGFGFVMMVRSLLGI